LKARLSSYFKSGSHDAKVTAMLAKVVDFDYFITKTENDALALEANLIKKHKPHYNILLKDSKSFPYIKIVDGDFPYIEVTRKITRSGKFFGPYFNGIWAKELLSVLCDVFPVRTCVKTVRAVESSKSVIPCLNYQIGRCTAPCAQHIGKEDYAKIIDDVSAFLRGERDCGAREILTKKMNNAAELEQYEIAIRYRNGLGFLDKLKERTIVEVARDLNCDVFAHAVRGEVLVVSVLTIRAGKMIGVQNFSDNVGGIETEDEMLQSFILQYYSQHVRPPEVITHHDVKIGVKKKLLDMAKANAEEYIETSIEKIKFKHEFTLGATEELQQVLGMATRPRKVECYDISHTDGEDQVASMVVFIDGVAERKLYRRFRIRHGEGNNDYLSMQETLRRRLARINTPDISFGPAPDLVVIDGGKGQLSSVMEILREVGSDLNVVSLAKENEEIFLPNNPNSIVLSRRSYALRLLQRIRDEAHRFANEYHKKLRGKSKIK